MAKINFQLDTKYLTPAAIVIAGLVVAGAIFLTASIKTGPGEQTAGTSPSADSGSQAQPSQPKEGAEAKFTITEEDHIRGNLEAPVTIVEFSDFQCPFCSRFHPTVQQVLEDYPDQVRWVYKHFPLDSIHSQARPAAEASECVFEQKGNEGFWQFADALFENQSRLGEDFYKELAQNLGVNINEFESCVSSRKYKDHVEADYQEGIKAGVRGTPGSFVNGESVSGAVPYETLKSAVERALANIQ